MTWLYTGDRDVENGGLFVLYDRYDLHNEYLTAVEVTPCGDAGGQHNAWWVSQLTINLDPKYIEKSVKSTGWLCFKGKVLYAGKKLLRRNTKAYALAVAEAVKSYGHTDDKGTTVVQIGKEAEGYGVMDVIQPHVTLRKGASLRHYVVTKVLPEAY